VRRLPVGVARCEGRSAVPLDLGPGNAAASELTVWRPREVGFDILVVPEMAWTTVTAYCRSPNASLTRGEVVVALARSAECRIQLD